MDLGRWGLKRISQISDRYRGLREFLAGALDGDHSLLGVDAVVASGGVAARAFDPKSDVERLRYALSLGRIPSAYRPIEVFKNLAPYFEAGFLIREGKLASMFLYGKVFEPKEDEAPEVEVDFPKFEPERVYQGRIVPVLKIFRLDSLRDLHGASAFALSPRTGVIYLLVCNRPHPWQVGLLEKTHQTVTELLGPARA